MIVLITYVVCLFCTMSLAANRFCEPSTHNCSNETSDSYLYHLFIEDCHRFLVEETFLWSVWSWLVAHQAWILSILASLVVGLSGIIPLLIIPIQEGANLITGAAARTLRVLLSFAVGVLHDDVFLHLLPDAWAAAETPAPEYNHNMNNRNFDPGVFWIDNGAPCVCGNSLCENTFEESVAHQLVMHNLEESAFISRDEAKVSQLLHSGKKLCRVGEDNNNTLIRATQWLSRYLFQYPPAHNFRGPRGETLLMMCDTAKKFEMLQAFGAEVNEISDDGDTILIHHIKYRLPKQVQKIVYFSSCMVESSQFEKEEMAEEIMKMFEVIVNSGVKLNATDKKGMTALQVMLQKFKPGYVFCPYHVFHPLPNGVGFSHFADACLLQNELASSFLSLLLEAGAEIPPPDQHGRTALMLAVLNPQNFDNIKTLIHRGVDVKAEDNAGKNAIYYLLASFAQHNIIDAIFGSHEFAIVDEIACYLLDSGCEMQGTELIMRDRCHRRSWWIYWKNVVHYLIARRTSSLRERSGNLNFQLKSEAGLLSFLSVFLETLGITCEGSDNGTMWNFAAEDVSFIKQRIAAGLDVNSGAFGYIYNELSKAQKAWVKKLCLPYPLMYTSAVKLHNFYIIADVEDSDIDDAQEQYQAIESMLRLLLPFWRHIPLALLIFELEAGKDEASILLRERMIKFLHEVGGPLSPGSEIYYAVEERLEEAVEEAPAYGEILLPLFHQLHSEVPSLLQLSRTALRASLEHTDSRGLDVSSLRFLSKGEMIPLPQEMVDYLSFRDSKVSIIKVLKEMISVLPAGFDGILD